MSQTDNKTRITLLDIFLLTAGCVLFAWATVAFTAENYGRAIFLMLTAIWVKLPHRR